VYEGRKENAAKEQRIAEKKSAIIAAEQAILRSVIAKQGGIATPEDDVFFQKFSTEILTLRAEVQKLQE